MMDHARLSASDRRPSYSSLADESHLLFPAMHHPDRKSSRSSSVFSLVATMVGGGVLSLPFAFARTGIALGLLYLLSSGAISAFSIRLLLSCSRRSGAQSYEEVMERTFGVRMKYATMLLLVMMTLMASLGYLVLIRDLAGPLVDNYVIGEPLGATGHSLTALAVVLPVVPLCFASSLNALRFTSFLSLVALLLLSVVVMYRCADKAAHVRPVRVADLRWASPSVEDSIYALPFMQLSFMCHFNVLPVHVGLRKPTRSRLDSVVFLTITAALVFYVAVSLSGYLFAYDYRCPANAGAKCKDGVPDNILNAFAAGDGLVDMGRTGFLLALMLSFPLLVLPCRMTLLRLVAEVAGTGDVDKDDLLMRGSMDVDELSRHNHYVSLGDEIEFDLAGGGGNGGIGNGGIGNGGIGNGVTGADPDPGADTDPGADAAAALGSLGVATEASELPSLLGPTAGPSALPLAVPPAVPPALPTRPGVSVDMLLNTPGGEELSIIDSTDSPEFRTPQIRRQERRMKLRLLRPFRVCSAAGAQHVIVTSTILVLAAVGMFVVPGISVVWSLTGSSVGMLLGFVFPSAAYISLRSPAGFFKPHAVDARFVGAWALFVFSSLLGVVCTVESIKSVANGTAS